MSGVPSFLVGPEAGRVVALVLLAVLALEAVAVALADSAVVVLAEAVVVFLSAVVFLSGVVCPKEKAAKNSMSVAASKDFFIIAKILVREIEA
jgi:hypothetical protein